MQPVLQVGLHLAGRRVVVVGGDANSEERVVRLLEAQARVLVVAPDLTEPLGRWAREHRIEHRRGTFEEADLDGCFLALVCQFDEPLGIRISELARERAILVYVHDRPSLSDVAMPALVRRGNLRLAISTEAESPALASRLRAELERIFDGHFVAYLEWLGELRAQVRDEEPDPHKRADRLRSATDGFFINAVLHYPEAYKGHAIFGKKDPHPKK